MTELIDKKEALAQIKSIPCATLEEITCKEVAVSRLRKTPTITEEEIRTKAIDEFAKLLTAACERANIGFDAKFGKVLYAHEDGT